MYSMINVTRRSSFCIATISLVIPLQGKRRAAKDVAQADYYQRLASLKKTDDGTQVLQPSLSKEDEA